MSPPHCFPSRRGGMLHPSHPPPRPGCKKKTKTKTRDLGELILNAEKMRVHFHHPFNLLQPRVEISSCNSASRALDCLFTSFNSPWAVSSWLRKVSMSGGLGMYIYSTTVSCLDDCTSAVGGLGPREMDTFPLNYSNGFIQIRMHCDNNSENIDLLSAEAPCEIIQHSWRNATVRNNTVKSMTCDSELY